MESWRRHKLAFAFLLGPGCAWLVLFFTAPLAILWVYSFGERGTYGDVIVTASLENYLRAIESIPLGIIWKSLWTAAITTAVTILVGLPVALGIAFAPPAWKNPLLVAVILPFWTNLLVRTYAWMAVLRGNGYLNQVLTWFHDRLSWILDLGGAVGVLPPFGPFDLLYSQAAVIVALIHIHLPFMVLPLYAVLEKLDRRYVEASLDLGASHWRTFRLVILPLAVPGLVTGTILVFILSLGNFVAADLLGGTDSLMVGNLIAQQFGASRDWPYGSALSFLLMYATFVLLWLRAAMRRERDPGDDTDARRMP
ncbi:MAG: ABC transporter permease [Alphaproteobacteria bacterium]